MADELVNGLIAHGIPSGKLHYELFSASTGQCGSFDVSVGEKTLNAEGFPSLLHALEAMALPVDSDCRSGSCGRCKIRLRSGRLKHVVSPQCRLEKDEYLACCAIPETQVEVAIH